MQFGDKGYDVQSAYTPSGVLYIAGAPRYNHTGRVIVYRFNGTNVKVTQNLEGEQVPTHMLIHTQYMTHCSVL